MAPNNERRASYQREWSRIGGDAWSSRAGGTIEIEFAAGGRMRITGAVDAAMLTAVVTALADGRPR